MKRLIDPDNVFEDDYGQPLSGGLVHFYTSGTATRRNTYSDVDLTVLNPNPMSLGSDGRLQSDVYGQGIFTVHPVGRTGSPGRSHDNIYATHDPDIVYVSDFGAALDGVTADDSQFAAALAAAVGSTLVIDGPMRLDSSVTIPATIYVIAQGAITMASGQYFTAMKITNEYLQYTSGFDDWYDIRAFGGKADDATYSNTAVWNACMAALHGKKLRIPNGVWYFNSKPTEATIGPSIYGEGISTCWLARNYSETGFEVPFIGFKGSAFNGHVIQDIGLYAWTGTTGGIMLKFTCNTNEAAGFNKVIRVLVSYNGGQYIHGYMVDGSPNNTGGAKGWRATYYDYLYVFIAPTTGLNAIYLKCNGGAFGSMVAAGRMLLTGLAGNYTGVTLHVNCISEIACDYVLGTIQGTANSITTTANTNLGFEFNGLLTAGVGSNLGASASPTGVRIASRRAQSRGSSSIANGATSSGAILHGLGNAPTAAQIHITQTIATTNDPGNLYVDTITASEFTVNCRSDPGASGLTFDWYCDLSI